MEAAQQGRGRLDYFFLKFFFIVNKWTTDTSFIASLKYCYLEYLCCLLILGDPGADSGGEGKSKQALLAVLYFSSCLIFPPV